MQNKTFTINQVRAYVEGWLGADDDIQALNMNQIKSMLNNALVCVDDPSDGIDDMVKRQSERGNITQRD
jgi:hypothetical protein